MTSEAEPRFLAIWDPAKAASNFAKHGVTFAQAATVLLDELAVTVFDEVHSEDEERWFALGQAKDGRLLAAPLKDRSTIETHAEPDRDMPAEIDCSSGTRGRFFSPATRLDWPDAWRGVRDKSDFKRQQERISTADKRRYIPRLDENPDKSPCESPEGRFSLPHDPSPLP